MIKKYKECNISSRHRPPHAHLILPVVSCQDGLRHLYSKDLKGLTSLGPQVRSRPWCGWHRYPWCHPSGSSTSLASVVRSSSPSPPPFYSTSPLRHPSKSSTPRPARAHQRAPSYSTHCTSVRTSSWANATSLAPRSRCAGCGG